MAIRRPPTTFSDEISAADLAANSDWTQGGDTPLASAKKTSWATYRTKLRDVPKDQKDKTTYASITWPSEPS